jgi:hypothetical protein
MKDGVSEGFRMVHGERLRGGREDRGAETRRDRAEGRRGVAFQITALLDDGVLGDGVTDDGRTAPKVPIRTADA